MSAIGVKLGYQVDLSVFAINTFATSIWLTASRYNHLLQYIAIISSMKNWLFSIMSEKPSSQKFLFLGKVKKTLGLLKIAAAQLQVYLPSLLRYFKPAPSTLPDPRGPLSDKVPSTAIEAANSEVRYIAKLAMTLLVWIASRLAHT